MSKILLLSSGLKHAQNYADPFLERLEVYLTHQCDCVDVRNTKSFDERTFFQYDQVIFIFFTALDSIPSSTLEMFHKLEGQKKENQDIYSLIICDEFETEKCDLSEKIVKQWCQTENLNYNGSLKIGSGLFIMKTASRFIVSKYIKDFAGAIVKRNEYYSRVTLFNENVFMKKGNQYWSKEIKKKKKEKKKDAK